MLRSEKFEGFVLAGGKSSRMGTDKAFLKIGQNSFIENAIDVLKPNCQKVTVVLNKQQINIIENIPKEVSYIFDIYENRGALGGIHAALRSCDTEFALFLACDMPNVTAKSVELLTKEVRETDSFCAYVPIQFDGRTQPLFAIYRRSLALVKAESFLNENSSASVKEFLKLVETKLIDPDLLNFDSNLFSNINTPKDLENIQPCGKLQILK